MVRPQIFWPDVFLTRLCLLGLAVLLVGCTVTREVTLYGGGLPSPARGELAGTLGSGTGEIYVVMPNGDRFAGRITFYWGAGYRQETAVATSSRGGLAIGFSQGGQRMCRATLVNAAGLTLDCLADVDPNTAHGTGVCVDGQQRRYTWHF
jgi:hypothetical protein